MSRGRRITGLVIIICALTMLVIWEKWAKPALVYDKIPVLKIDLQKGDELKDGMISYVESSCGEKYISKAEISKYIGTRAKHFIHKGTPLFSEYLGKPESLVDISRDRLAVVLPKSAIHNYSSQIKREDIVLIYDEADLIIRAKVSSVMDDTHGFEVITSQSEAAKISEAISKGRKLLIVRGS